MNSKNLNTTLSYYTNSFTKYIFILFASTISRVTLCQQITDLRFVTSFGDFSNAISATVDPQNNIYIADKGSNKIFKYSSDYRLLISAGGYGWDQITFDNPTDISSSFGLNFYVCDYGNHRIQRFDRNLNYISSYFTRNDDDIEKRFGYPLGCAVNSKGEVFFIDGENKRIVKLNSFFDFEKSFGGIDAGKGRLDNPSKIRVDENNFIYVLDKNRILIFDSFGNYLDNFSLNFSDTTISLALDNNFFYLLQKSGLKVFLKNQNMRTENRNSPVFDLSFNSVYSEDLKNKIELKNCSDILIHDETVLILTQNKGYVFTKINSR